MRNRVNLFTVLGLAVSIGVSLVSTASKSAALLTVDPGTGRTTTFTNEGITRTPGSVTLDGFSITGVPSVSYGNATYGLGANYIWSADKDFPWIASESGFGAVTFDLGTGYSFAGGFINYAPDEASHAIITALDANMAVIASYDLEELAPVSTPGEVNGGAFRGVQSDAADIRYFVIGGSYIIAHSLEVGSVPEPASLALLGTGLAGLALVRHRKGSPKAV